MKQVFEADSALVLARGLLMHQTPLKRDCGRLCGAACCAPDSERGLGMLLFPGEEALYRPLPQGFAISQGPKPGQRLLTCQGSCRREDRPLACRVFPLMFVADDQGQPSIALDPRAWPVCPLMPEGLDGLSAEFVQAARQAAGVLWEDPRQQAFVKAQQQDALAYTRAIPELEGLL